MKSTDLPPSILSSVRAGIRDVSPSSPTDAMRKPLLPLLPCVQKLRFTHSSHAAALYVSIRSDGISEVSLSHTVRSFLKLLASGSNATIFSVSGKNDRNSFTVSPLYAPRSAYELYFLPENISVKSLSADDAPRSAWRHPVSFPSVIPSKMRRDSSSARSFLADEIFSRF